MDIHMYLCIYTPTHVLNIFTLLKILMISTVDTTMSYLSIGRDLYNFLYLEEDLYPFQKEASSVSANNSLANTALMAKRNSTMLRRTSVGKVVSGFQRRSITSYEPNKSIKISSRDISNFTISRAKTLMTGDLLVVKENTRYYFVLGQHTLYYTVNDSDEIPKGELSLTEYSHVDVDTENPSQFILQNLTLGNIIVLKSYSKENMTAWVSAIQAVHDNLQNIKGSFYFQRNVRLQYFLYIKIWDAREIRNGKDTFTAIIINGIERGRTCTEWQTNNPPTMQSSTFR
eukprot:TRINITY_DN7688_c0_g2_i1.p1 TRINITY_DN7688_c0_g2~~TRINITY_DN7688_c0_g2_i1.p1  ORF type:complete len:286 (+),score=38.06 TRINITY_DN7688_c0_g2_i1:292-1149(+)